MALRLFLLCCFAVLLHGDSWACGWDDDTLAAEAKGMPSVTRIITGRFERNPPLYYQMRLKRVTAELRINPRELRNYDNAAVACDRLGDSHEAIVWMNKKREQLGRADPKKPQTREHWYRYNANIGTFWAHRWLRNGANRVRVAEVKKAHDFIAEAIKINPNAHFGREKYQLRMLRALIKPPAMAPKAYELPDLLNPRYGEGNSYESAFEAVKGLSGLIVLGDAWESIDVFNSLANALQNDDRRSYLAYMALLRACDIVDKGKKSLVSRAPAGDKLKSLLESSVEASMRGYLVANTAKNYQTLSEEARQWQERRTAYMMARFQVGQHPDTHPDFWRDYEETSPPEIYETPWWATPIAQGFFAFIAIFVVAPVTLFKTIKRRRKQRKAVAA